jgi:hypothetical protein
MALATNYMCAHINILVILLFNTNTNTKQHKNNKTTTINAPFSPFAGMQVDVVGVMPHFDDMQRSITRVANAKNLANAAATAGRHRFRFPKFEVLQTHHTGTAVSSTNSSSRGVDLGADPNLMLWPRPTMDMLLSRPVSCIC